MGEIQSNNKTIDNQNNYGSQSYDGLIKKVGNYKFSKLENVNQLNFKPIFLDDGLIFFDKKGSIIRYKDTKKIKSIFIDEVQFLKKDQIDQLSKIADNLNIPVMCYGLRTNFMGELFEGSDRLLSIADNLHEIKTICSYCARKATMVIKINTEGNAETEGAEIKIGGNDLYKSVCRKHFRKLTKLV